MTDEELREQIIEIAKEYDVELSDNQINQLIELCRAMEKLDTSALLAKVQAVQETLRQFADAKDKLSGFAGTVKETVQNIMEAIGSFFNRVLDLFRK